MEAASAKLQDFNLPFDVPLLQQVVETAYNASHPNRAEANTLLMQMRESLEMWTRVDAILEQSEHTQTKFFALSILDDAILTRWKIMTAKQRDGIKNYIVTKIIQISSSEEQLKKEKVFVSKMNQVLVAILKQEWPHNWPTFISDIVGSSKTSEVLCENNMQILKLLSEEVFDYGKDQMTTAKIKTMKESLNEEFAKVYQLCEFILEHSQRPSLLIVTLQTLQRFLTWIPLGYIFETNLIRTLLGKFFPAPLFRTQALECLTEIASLSELSPDYDQHFRVLYVTLMEQLANVVAPDTDLASQYEDMCDSDQIFIRKLALFLTSFFKDHLRVLENAEQQNGMLIGLTYLVRISEVPDEEVFKICLEYYQTLSQDLYKSEVSYSPSVARHLMRPPSRKDVFQGVLSRIRGVLIMRMAKPEEVLIVEDDNGEIVRETTKDTEAIAQYKAMRETLVHLTHLNYEDTESIMLERLSLQVDGREFSWNKLNTLCWAIGSISGAMSEEEEKRFLVTVIKDLLNLCENKRGKENKAVIASNIMYVVGQYPRFLRAHWKFLRTVVNKLFEFMHELHPGVQDMACDTFLKIAQKCKRKFVTVQQEEPRPFIEELLQQLPTIVSDLENHQVHTFYEAVACMLSERGHTIPLDRVAMLMTLTQLPNDAWKDIFARAQDQPDSILLPDTVKEVTKILRTNVRICGAVGSLFTYQLRGMYLDMLQVYRFYSEHISQAVAAQGDIATRHSNIKAMRGAKKEALKLLSVFIEVSGEPDAPPEIVAQTFVPPMLDPVLGDYQRCIAGARDPEVLTLFAVAVERLKEHVVPIVPRIMSAVFECTLQMITRNFEDFPEHRIRFFQFIKAVNNHCFGALFDIPAEHQQLVVDSVVWAFKHTERNIAETGLEILHKLLENVGRTPAVAQGFYQQYLLALIQDILAVMTDRLHKSGFKMHATLLSLIFHLVATGKVTDPLYDPQLHPQATDNKQFLGEYVCKLLLTSFPNLNKGQVVTFVQSLFDVNMDLPTYKQHLRDFLVSIKEFSGEDNTDLYSEERQKLQVQQLEEARAARLAVPGLVNPHDRPDDMADL